MTKTRLLLVDGHALMCQGLRAMLAPEYEVVGEVYDGERVLHAVALLRPHVVLLDLALAGKGGAGVLQDLLVTRARPAVVIVSMQVERAVAEEMIALGARAFVPRDARLPELRTAIEAARAGRRFISPRIPPDGAADAQHYPSGFAPLTAREQQIVRLIGAGLTSDRIAGELRISYHTVHFHRTKIRRKLGFQSEYEMNRFAIMVLQADAEGRKSASLPETPLPGRPLV